MTVFERLRHSKLAGLLAKIGLSALVFWFVFRNVDFSGLPEMVHRQRAIGLAGGILFIFLQTAVGSMRWRQILKALSDTGRHLLSGWEAFKLVYIGSFFNCCLPGTVGGDVVRVWLTKSEQIPTSLAINSVVIDRLIALVAIGVLVAVTFPMLGSDAGFNPLPFLAAAVAAAVLGIWLLFHLEKRLAPWKHKRPVGWLFYLVHCLRLLLKHRAMSFMSVVYAMASHICYCLAAWALAHSLGSDVTALQCITLMPWVLLMTILPISMGGWGVREAGVVTFLGMAGVTKMQSLTISVELGLLGILLTLPFGVLWLGYRKKKPMPKEGLA